jgi:branched-chain amino acid transport system substrate-binding protein
MRSRDQPRSGVDTICLPGVGKLLRAVCATILMGMALFDAAALAQSAPPADTVKIVVASSLSGFGAVTGIPVLDAARFAVEEANADGEAPRVELIVYDDQTREDGAKAVAGQIATSDALVVVGHDYSFLCLTAGPLYAEAGLAAISPTCISDRITDNATTFRTTFSTSEMGDLLANYLHHALGGMRAVLIFKDDGYGRPIMSGFKAAAERLGIVTAYHSFTTAAEVGEIARRTEADPEQPTIVLGILENDAAPVLATLRRQGARARVLGSDAIANDAFADAFADYPEYHQDRGFFTDRVYTVSPWIPDSANAEALAFAERFRARYGHEPTWYAVQGYDATRLAIAAARAAVAAETRAVSNLQSRRAAVRAYLASLDGPAHAVASLTGPLWFTPERGRQQAARIGRFHGALFESAPLQIVPVINPDPAEITSGAVFELASGRYARLQRVVYTGVFINEIPRLDLTRSSFTANFYLWLRFASEAGPDSADPTDLIFPNLISGSFDRAHPAERRRMADNTEYWLWRVQGEFRNDFDLHRFPFDRQALSLSFFNTRAPMERIVYVLDKRSVKGRNGSAVFADPPSITAPAAFRHLTQWNPLGAHSRRENLSIHDPVDSPARWRECIRVADNSL